MVKELGLEESVVMTGEVQGETKDCLLANAEVFVLPSYSENFGIVVAEAMAWGCPVIASTGTPWQEIDEVGAGWWVDPHERELSRALGQALGLTQEQLFAKGVIGHSLAKRKYSWAQAAELLLASYVTLVDRTEKPKQGSPCTSL
jgi:glycosyltransferase involved in cell wall biosynthesis